MPAAQEREPGRARSTGGAALVALGARRASGRAGVWIRGRGPAAEAEGGRAQGRGPPAWRRAPPLPAPEVEQTHINQSEHSSE